MTTTVNALCYKSKTLSNGEHPLMICVCKDGKRKYKSLGVSVKAEHWNFEKNLPKTNCPNKEYIQLLQDENRRGYMLSVKQVYNSLVKYNKHLDILQVTSIPFTAFIEEENYWLVIQRKRRKEVEDDLFDGKFVYRCIVTNDLDSTEEEIITFYNARGSSEKKFDVMNNDFGWSKLPCSFLNENTAFLLLTAIAANVYLYLIGKIAKVFTDIKPESRIKKIPASIYCSTRKMDKNGKKMGFEYLFPKTASFIMANLIFDF